MNSIHLRILNAGVFESDDIPNISYSLKYTDGRKIRLVDGSGQVNSVRGTVEIFHNNSWGTVCDDGFQQQAATVICHMLGWESP